MTGDNTKVFLSYAHEDIGMAKKIYNDLKRFGVDVWFDNESLIPGQKWKIAIERAIKESSFCMVLLSSTSTGKRGFLNKELRIALEILDQCPEDDIYILPVRLDQCNPSYLELDELHWIDLFPEEKYDDGIRKLLDIIRPGALRLRSQPKELSHGDASAMIRKYTFYDIYLNPESNGFWNKFSETELAGEGIVIDGATGLMWRKQSSFSSGNLDFPVIDHESIDYFIEEFNNQNKTGYHDWRLPTLEEAMSLMRPKNYTSHILNPVYIDLIFEPKKADDLICWTSDSVRTESGQWLVDYANGYCGRSVPGSRACIRLVRTNA